MIYERLYFEDMKTMLNRKDWRTIKRWCLKNGVSLFKDIGSNRWFAIKNDFEKAFTPNRNKPSILNSTINYFSNYYQTRSLKHQEYKSQGEIEKQFLSILQSVKTAL